MKNFKSHLPCLCCGHSIDGEVAWHHVKTRGAFGVNEPWNLMPLCKKHHVMIHDIGKVNMANRFLDVHEWFVENGWEIINDRWCHVYKIDK